MLTLLAFVGRSVLWLEQSTDEPTRGEEETREEPAFVPLAPGVPSEREEEHQVKDPQATAEPPAVHRQ
jgi:hypothetical protein